MLRARQAIRIIDKFEKATAETKRAAVLPPTAEGPESDLDSKARGFNNSLPETGVAGDSSLESVAEIPGDRALQRPSSHTTVDIPELATRDSATVSLDFKTCGSYGIKQVFPLGHACSVSLR